MKEQGREYKNKMSFLEGSFYVCLGFGLVIFLLCIEA